MIFYLGSHMPSWLAQTDVPLFISHRRLARQKTWPRALGPWALDSGGFTEIGDHGEWTIPETEYVAAVRAYRDEIGQMQWAAPMDWMCEPPMTARSGRPIVEHQVRTVHNLLYLRYLAPDLPFIPVLQGWQLDDYLRCADLYERCGISLDAEPLVGVGSVCRRQATSQIERLLRRLAADGLNLHGFGVKRGGLGRYRSVLASADSMAWSLRGRNVPGCTSSHLAENNCLRFALEWREQTEAASSAPDEEYVEQMEMAL